MFIASPIDQVTANSIEDEIDALLEKQERLIRELQNALFPCKHNPTLCPDDLIRCANCGELC
jgi:hypothetical protein